MMWRTASCYLCVLACLALVGCMETELVIDQSKTVDEGEPAGTAYLAVADKEGTTGHLRRFDGEPSEVVDATTTAALQLLAEALGAGEG